MNEWWAYLHTNGTIQVKRFLGSVADIVEDCLESPFVVKFTTPFPAKDREDAERLAKIKLK